MNDRNIMTVAFKLMLMVGAVLVSQQGFANSRMSFFQQKDSIPVDSMVKDPMSIKNKFQERHVNQWNRTASKIKNVEGSSTIYTEDLNTTPVADITNVFAGRLAGFSANQGSGRTNPLFSFASYSLRGQTPLIVVDGVIRNFTSFNVDDIKSITVMKDAVSTSMFGLRSSNGIVYITTRDRSDEKNFEMNFEAQYGSAQQFKRPKFVLGADYARLYNEAQQNTFPGATPAYSETAIAAYQNGTNNPFTQPSNDWFNSIYKDNFAQQRYTLNAAGNGKNYRYYTALENFSQGGNFITSKDNAYNTNNYYNRYNIRTNAQVDFSNNIQLDLKIFGSIESSNEPGAGAATILSRIFSTSPLQYPAKNADGSYGGVPANVTNILASTLSSGYINYNERTLSSDVSLKFKLDDLTPGLWAKGLISINNYYLQSISRTKTFAIYYLPTPDATAYTKIGSDGTLVAGSGSSALGTQSKQTFYNILLGYDKTFGKNSLNLLGTYNGDNVINSYTQLNQIYKNLGLTANYDYDSKYLAELGLVYSGFNRYKKDARWTFLPSVGLGWIISKEDWFKAKGIDLLKVRGSAGYTAWADPNNYYTYLQNYTINTTGYNFGSSATAVSGTEEGTLANPNLIRERALKLDIGMEAEFFRNRLNLELNYYNNKYADELISPVNGYGSGIIGQNYPVINGGSYRYSGIEANIGFADKAGDFNYFIKGNFSLAKNKVLDLQEGNLVYPWLYRAGSPSGSFGYEAIGFYQVGEDVTKTANTPGYLPQAGDIKYNDLNNDGIINFVDQKLMTGKKPSILLGLNIGFQFKNFDFNALLQGNLNRDINYNGSSFSAFNNGLGNVLDYTTENRWTPENPVNATLPRFTLGANANNTLPSTFWVKSADYIRLKNAEIGYNVPQKLLKRIKLSGLRFFANGYNLITWTKLDYLDPETGLSQFPNYRIINGGISIKL